MSFNLRYASAKPPQAWPDRLPVVRHVIAQHTPDVIGTQEGLFEQLTDIEQGLPDYRWIGLGRDGGSRGEFMAVFYRPERLEPLAFDHFWLSDTPNVIGSATWGNTNRRMVTHVHFRDRTTGSTFYFWNTHFDFTDDFHIRSAALLQSQMRLLDPTMPLILVGDFNAVAEKAPVWPLLVNDTPDGLTDTWATAQERRSPAVSTFHGYQGPSLAGDRIDWILTRGLPRARAAEIITFASETGQYPSDHFPIVADLPLSAV